MKKLLFALVLTVSLNVAKAEDLVWYNNVAKASEIAKSQNKPLMMFFTGSDWCGWCKRLQKEVFYTPEFIKWAKEQVILVELDFPRTFQLTPEIATQNQSLQQMFGISGYPTVWFVKAEVNGTKVSFTKLGSTGYVAGGPQPWITGANSIIVK